MKIGFDGTWAVGDFRGTGKFTRALLKGYLQDAITYVPKGLSDPELNVLAGGPGNFLLWEQVYLPWAVRRDQLDLFVAPYNTAPLTLPRSCHLILIVHDLIFMSPWVGAGSALSRQQLGRRYRSTICGPSIRRADKIITVSEHTANEIIQTWPAAAKKLTIIPNTISSTWFDAPRSVGPIKAPYIMTVSGWGPSKNLMTAINAFLAAVDAMPTLSHKFLIAGLQEEHQTWYRSTLKNRDNADRLVFLPFCNEDSLRTLYDGACLFLFPSKQEGFGIPLLEAMSRQCPIITTSQSVMPEIVGDAALKVSADDTQAMADAIQSLLSSTTARESLSHKAKVRSMVYHPEKVTKQIRNFWKTIN